MSDQPTSDPSASEPTQFIPAQPPPPPPPTQQLYTQPPPGGPSGGRRWILNVLLVLLGLAAGFILAQVFGGKETKIPSEDFVLFENASSTFPVAGARFTESTFDERTGRCSKELLKQYLRADPRRFHAWLELQGILESEFDAFVDRLETRILTAATPVTNHGCFGEGQGPCPFAIQSVLAAGTPVWWDPVNQRIVAKCRCSNPIKPPRCPPNCEGGTPPPLTATPHETEPTRTHPPRTQPPFTQPPFTEPPFTQPPFTEPAHTQPPFTEPPPTEPPTQTEPPLDCAKTPNDPRCAIG